jgi:eukaryotic-like serine/threonine-protein kinase
MQDLEEKRLAHYTIQRLLARGGMSQVYLALDERTQQDVAIKVVHCSEDDYFLRFQREIKTLSALSHEHILPIIDSGAHGSWHYCVMPYIERGSLRERLAKGPLTQEEAGNILAQIASALQFAHDHGTLHRDIKPSNILLKDDNQIYLADFGLAKDTKEASTITQTGCLIGTPEYMAPELAEEPATSSSDIYAVGILLYQMLTGRVPFKGKTPLSIYWKHIKEQPAPPALLNPDISYAVEEVVLHALEKAPERRFKTVQDMAQAYTRALQTSERSKMVQLQGARILSGLTLPVPTQRVIPVSAVAGGSRRRVHPAIALLIAALLFMLPLSLGFSMYISTSLRAPIAQGASAQFTSINSTLHQVPPIPLGNSASSNVRSYNQQGNGQGYSSQNNGNGRSNGNQGKGHGHKHGHDHDH